MDEKIKADKETELNPSKHQKESGNYIKDKLSVYGFDIAIENPSGSNRTGTDKSGVKWSVFMPYSYGYFENTIGVDGDEIDVFLGDFLESDFEVYVVNQIDPKSGIFDEHKVMFGFKDIDSAKQGYLDSYSKDWKGFSSITSFSLDSFKNWMVNKYTTKGSANKIKSINNVEIKNEENSVIRLIKLEGAVIEGETLKNLQEQAGKIDEFDNLVIEIASPGGSVYEGLLIMVWMNLLSEMGKNVTTIVTANAYSIASLIMLAANNKLISNSADIMVHNPMVPEIQYANANDLEIHLTSLRNLEDVMYELYILFTDLSREEIKKLMDKETYLDAKQAVNYGFADKVVDIKKRQKSVAANIKKESNMKNTLNLLHRVIGMVNGAQFVNQLYYDDKGGEFEIFQKDPSQYQTGDRTSLESGEIILSDGAKITIVDFLITSIEKNVPGETSVPEVEDLSYGKERMADMPVITNPAPAVAPKEEKVVAMDDPMKKEEMAADPMKDKEKEMIISMDDPMKEKEMVIEPVPEMDHSQPSITMEDFMKLQEIVDALVVEVNRLTDESGAVEAKFLEAKAFEELAAQAIDTLAKNTTSNFKPSARAKVGASPTGSIFQRALANKMQESDFKK